MREVRLDSSPGHRVTRWLALVAAMLTASVALLFGLSAPAGATPAQPLAYPPTVCATLAVSTTTPAENEPITVSGVNFSPNTTLTLELDNSAHKLGTVRTDAQGSFTTTVTMPPGVTGSHLIIAVGGTTKNCPVDPSVRIDIQAAGRQGGGAAGGGSGSGGSHGGTAFTGVDILLLLVIAAGLVGAGVALVRSGRRRKQVEWYAS